jgi:regulator of cell morphogenesis and NO signaling
MTEKTVAELAVEMPSATQVFEKLGIDYCCGGSRTLEQACRAANRTLDEVIRSLEAANTPGPADRNDRDWGRESLSDLIDHIQNTHHNYVRQETSRLLPLFEKVCSVHGSNHPELYALRETFTDLADELRNHLFKEERILFPYIVRLEEAVIEKESVIPPPFGTVQNPVAMMIHEHDNAGEALRFLRRRTNGYTAPPDACPSYRLLYSALADFEADLHQHIHLENNILFPRAIALEETH